MNGSTVLGTRVRISVDGAEIAARDQQDNVFWNYIFDEPLIAGHREISVTATNETGFESEPTIISVEIPAIPTITSLTNLQTVTRETVAIEGSAEPSAQVNLFVDEVFVKTVQADAQGSYYIDGLSDLPLGQHNVMVESVRTLGNFGNRSAAISIIVL